MQSFHKLQYRKVPGGPTLYAYKPDAYKRIQASVKQCAIDYKKDKEDKKEPQLGRLERLENLARVLHKVLTYNPDETISFDKSRLKRGIVKEFLESDLPSVITRIQIEERVGSVTVPVHFLTEYEIKGRHEYGYLIPRIRT